MKLLFCIKLQYWHSIVQRSNEPMRRRFRILRRKKKKVYKFRSLALFGRASASPIMSIWPPPPGHSLQLYRLLFPSAQRLLLLGALVLQNHNNNHFIITLKDLTLLKTWNSQPISCFKNYNNSRLHFDFINWWIYL